MEGQGRVGVGVKGEVNGGGWGVVDTILGSFSIHDASGSINLAIKMNPDFYRIEIDAMYMFQSSRIYVLHKTSHKATFSRRGRIGTAMNCLT